MKTTEFIVSFFIAIIFWSVICYIATVILPDFRSPGPDNAVHSYSLQGSSLEPSGPTIDINKCVNCHTILLPYDTKIANQKLQAK